MSDWRQVAMVRLEKHSNYEVKPEQGIEPTWRGAWMSLAGDPRRVQGVVGKRGNEYFAGIAVRERTGRVNVDWGPPLDDPEFAKSLAQVGATCWLDGEAHKAVKKEQEPPQRGRAR